MGRPKGSKNKPKVAPVVAAPVQPPPVIAPAPSPVAEQVASVTAGISVVGIAQRLYKNFPEFLKIVWRETIPGSPDPTPIQYDLADYLQNGPSRRMVLGFRGLAKSYAFGAYFMWRLLHDPEERMKYLSGDEDKVIQFSNWTKNLREIHGLPFLRHLRSKKGQKDDQYLWDVGPASLQQYNSFMGSPATAAIAGGRCTIGGLDDCEQNSNSDSELKRSKLLKNMLDVSNMLIPESKQDMIVLGTYKSLNSVYITMARERGYDVMAFPCLVPSRPKDYGNRLAPTIAEWAKDKTRVGESTEPTRFSVKELKVHEKEKGPLQFQLEWMVSDQCGDQFEHPFPLNRLIVWNGSNTQFAPARIQQGSGERDKITDLPMHGNTGDAFYAPSHVDTSATIPYGTVLTAIDPSGSSEGDEAAWVTIGAVPGQLHLLDWGGAPNGSSPQTMKKIAVATKRCLSREIIFENNMQSWGALFEQTLRSEGHYCKFEGVRNSKNKEARIAETLEPIIYGGQLIVSRKALQQEHDELLRSGDPRWKERLLQYQLAMFRRWAKGGGLEYDDRLDALALACAYLAPKFLRSNTDAIAEAQRDRMAMEREQRWRESIYGDREEEPLWAQVRR